MSSSLMEVMHFSRGSIKFGLIVPDLGAGTVCLNKRAKFVQIVLELKSQEQLWMDISNVVWAILYDIPTIDG